MGSFSEDKSNFKTKIFLAGFLSVAALAGSVMPVSYTHLTLPTKA